MRTPSTKSERGPKFSDRVLVLPFLSAPHPATLCLSEQILFLFLYPVTLPFVQSSAQRRVPYLRVRWEASQDFQTPHSQLFHWGGMDWSYLGPVGGLGKEHEWKPLR
ncbi:UNVERIFIED_CONTAM: hypothetical protein K2H54_064226 [Gekko kuhli]